MFLFCYSPDLEFGKYTVVLTRNKHYTAFKSSCHLSVTRIKIYNLFFNEKPSKQQLLTDSNENRIIYLTDLSTS